LSSLYLLSVFLIHSLAFTFPGPRGGFFHASSAALPFLFAAGSVGPGTAVGWAARQRRWNRRQAETVFTTAAAAAAAALSLYALAQKAPDWQRTDVVYEQAGRWMAQRGHAESTVVVVANPPAFWYYTRQPAVVVPNGDVAVLLAAADRYAAQYVLLDANHPSDLHEVYTNTLEHPRLRRVMAWETEARTAALLFEVLR
jgi:hypothetical protein